MKIYIAVGGIGCFILSTFQKNEQLDNKYCYYIDSDVQSLAQVIKDNNSNIIQLGMVSDHVVQGTGGHRNIGRLVTRFGILSNRMNNAFDPLKKMSGIELVFITSSFGGTGSGAVFEIAEYIQALLWSGGHNRYESCTIIAFGQKCFDFCYQVPKIIKDAFEMNTIQMVMEAATKSSSKIDKTINRGIVASIFNPYYDLVLFDEKIYDFDSLYKVLQLNKSEIDTLNSAQKHLVKPKSSNPDVFISYSSADQEVADLVADTLKDNGITTWIASRSIAEGSYAKQIIQGINGAKVFVVLLSKNSVSSQHVKNEIDRAFSRLNDGLIMIPFIIEKCKLDEESEYYLCRQEMLDGSNPPVTQRISDLAMRIKNSLE